MSAPKSKMDLVQSACTFETIFLPQNKNASKSEEMMNNWLDSQPKMCDLLAAPLSNNVIKPRLKKSKLECSNRFTPTHKKVLKVVAAEIQDLKHMNTTLKTEFKDCKQQS